MAAARVVLVDDEVNVLNALQRALRKEGYETVVTTHPEEALALLAQSPCAVLVSDQRMPTLEGTRLLEKAREASPDTVRILLTGYADTQAAVDAINRGAAFRFLTKPWEDAALKAELRGAVAHYELVLENRRLQALTAAQNAELQDLNRNLERKVEERTREVTRLNERLRKSFLGSVRVLAELTERNNAEIGSHGKRVAEISRAMGARMGVRHWDLFHLEVAGALHDIGHLAVPPEVLQKPPEELTLEDTRDLQDHVLQGESIVAMIPDMEEAAALIRHHHERLDGTGFPDRLHGEEIPLGSRIIAVADAYDKLLGDEDMPPRDALGMLQRGAGYAFDPAAVEALAACLAEGDIRI